MTNEINPVCPNPNCRVLEPIHYLVFQEFVILSQKQKRNLGKSFSLTVKWKMEKNKTWATIF